MRKTKPSTASRAAAANAKGAAKKTAGPVRRTASKKTGAKTVSGPVRPTKASGG